MQREVRCSSFRGALARASRLAWRVSQAKNGEGGQVQAEEHNLVSGGLLSMISPVSDTVK